MQRRRNWCPSASFPSPEDSYEDVSKNTSTSTSKKRITRRSTPTVDVRKQSITLPQLQAKSDDSQKEESGYETVENASYDQLEYFYAYSSYDKENLALCGWRKNEHIRTGNELSHATVTATRGSLQSRELSSRLYPSRLNSRLTRKREQYCFQHCDDVEDHLKRYNSFCSYSLLQCLPQGRRDSTVIEEDQMKIEIISLNSHHDETDEVSDEPIVNLTHLRSLATRLGVKESIKEPQLLQSPRPAPSIAKQRRDCIEELIICPPTSNTKPKETITSKRQSRLSSQKQTRHFPSLTQPIQPKNKSHSTISITKYLRVNTKVNPTDNEEQSDNNNKEEQNQMELVNCSSSSFLSSSSSIETDNNSKNIKQESCWPTFCAVTDNNNLEKEEIIRRKANSLGLLSHKWAKNFIERGFMNGHLPRKLYYDISRPATRHNTSKDHVQQTEAKTDRKNSGQPAKTQRSKTVNSSRARSNETKMKLQELETVYGTKQKRQLSTATKTDSSTRTLTQKGVERKPSLVHCRPSTHHEENFKMKQNSTVRHWHVKGEKWQVRNNFEVLNRLTIES